MFRLTLPLALVAAFALAACGVKGPLEPPPGAPQPPAPQAQVVVPPPSTSAAGFHSATSASDMASSATPHADWEKSQQSTSGAKSDPLKGVARPNQPFILDGLL
ncbi:LPS translocon maturation chaperone LptM [Xanthobacter agilis]|jgi:predicted small lipoprotein YifL|uniref:Small lipoprotein YifL n=1 Tax=Xanthobacter agilis TaxID=47492 RepID=A0ABU0LF13_XANAG|nr:lipoprotein [Xanthobacter agilis]MDQ0505729.1 putative small lipoprotein YifL [Xanthobacter agilis]